MPLTNKSSVKFVYYGGVEGSYQHQDVSDLSFLDSFYGANAFSYEEAQLIKATLTFSGPALEHVNTGFPGPISIAAATDGIEFFFPQTRVGDYAGDDINTPINVTFTSAAAPLADLSFSFFDGADGPNMNVTGATTIAMSDDDDARAESWGVWLPEDIKPDFFTGTSGDDKMKGARDYNILSGGDGNDTISVSRGQGWLFGGSGNDTLKGNDNDDFLFGGADDDRLEGNGGNDILMGGAGNDQLFGHEDDDQLFGGMGSDFLKGGSGNDELWGGADDDTLWGNDGDDYLNGGSGNDFLDGGSGDDIVIGGTGNDRIDGGPGSDTFIFANGDGIDTIFGFVSGVDTIDLGGTSISSFVELMAAATEVDDDLIFDYSASLGFTLILHGTSPHEISAGDFLF